jgi:hypothetical protein
MPASKSRRKTLTQSPGRGQSALGATPYIGYVQKFTLQREAPHRAPAERRSANVARNLHVSTEITWIARQGRPRRFGPVLRRPTQADSTRDVGAPPTSLLEAYRSAARPCPPVPGVARAGATTLVVCQTFALDGP